MREEPFRLTPTDGVIPGGSEGFESVDLIGARCAPTMEELGYALVSWNTELLPLEARGLRK